MSLIWVMSGRRDTLELSELINEYEVAESKLKEAEMEVQRIKQDLIDFYFDINVRPVPVARRIKEEIDWTKKEFSSILKELQRTLESYSGYRSKENESEIKERFEID